MSGLDHRLEPEGEIRRFEIINGAMGRRRWSADDRARILEETLMPVETGDYLKLMLGASERVTDASHVSPQGLGPTLPCHK